MVIERFEDIRAWQGARELTKGVYEITRQGRFGRDAGLCGQIRRASVSVMANIAEGFDRRSRKDFANFLNIAFASATEVKSHLYVALDQEYITRDQFESLYSNCSETAKMILGFMKYLKGAPSIVSSSSPTSNVERRTSNKRRSS